MNLRHMAFLSLLLVALQHPAVAETLPLPPGLIDMRSDEGGRILFHSDTRQAYLTLASQFVMQKNTSFCGVASIVMVLNALGVPAPVDEDLAPYTVFTQDNFLDARSDAIITQDAIRHKGINLDQLGGLLSLYPVTVAVHHASDTTLSEFRTKASSYLAQPQHFVIVNYLRKTIGQKTGGHISPLAAYDAETDRFLILDVARYKYPPVWVKAADLFDAMNETDTGNMNRTRGFILISKP